MDPEIKEILIMSTIFCLVSLGVFMLIFIMCLIVKVDIDGFGAVFMILGSLFFGAAASSR